MRYRIEKNTVQETLVIPLLGRLVCSERYPELFSDPEAERICDSLEYDFAEKRKKMETPAGLIVLALLAELVRGLNGYGTRKGVRRSFVPLAFSFYAYSAHWWTDTDGSLAAAAEEMPAGYAGKMETVIGNVPLLIVMLVLTIPVAILAMRLAEKALKKQAASLK